ncbi:sensor histidine kinase [Nostoc sp.]|uniref:sensor histidine kinase n=1 Tax=Nostoc sp. TaxID=1180 RepID=UPI002FF79C20
MSIDLAGVPYALLIANDITERKRLENEFISLVSLITATEAMQAMADKLQVRLIINPVAVELWADPDRLLQTLTNLLSNAIKFSEPGDTVWISATLSESRGVESEENQPSSSNFLLITIQDEGRGIPEDKLQIIFERFQQVDASDSRNKGGTGLGIAICRDIMRE